MAEYGYLTILFFFSKAAQGNGSFSIKKASPYIKIKSLFYVKSFESKKEDINKKKI